MFTPNMNSENLLASFDVDEQNLLVSIFLNDHVDIFTNAEPNNNALFPALVLDGSDTPLSSDNELSLQPFPEELQDFKLVFETSCETRAFQGDEHNIPTMSSEGKIKKRARRSNNEEDQDLSEAPKKKRRGRPKGSKQEKDFPKKNLSAYNLFFRDERQRLLASIKGSDNEKNFTSAIRKDRAAPHRKISFSELGKVIGQNWKTLSEVTRAKYNKMAEEEKKVYQEKVKEYKRKKEGEKSCC